MEKLHRLATRRGLISIGTIAGKTHRPGTEKSPILSTLDAFEPHDSIQEGFTEALEVTGWNCIVIRSYNWSWDLALKARAQDIAKRRGIELIIHDD
jgi:hypothetical protein